MDIRPISMPAIQGIGKAPSAPSSTGAVEGGSDFANLIAKSLQQVNASQNQADATAHQYQLGQGDVSLEDAMISMQKANISFQTTVQVRNKLVSAYNDIMNMQL